MNLQSLLVILLPVAQVKTNPSHLDLWVGASITEPVNEERYSLPLIIFLLKKNLITMSCVIHIASNARNGWTPKEISDLSFFKLTLNYQL